MMVFRCIPGTFTLCLSLVLLSCSAPPKKPSPTLSHIHIGHAITGWAAAPDKQGLLVAAEVLGVKAQASGELLKAAATEGDLDNSKRLLEDIALAIDPTIVDESLADQFGLRRATAEAMVHLEVAASIYDATPNVRRTVARVNVKAQEILNQTDELLIFLETALASNDITEIQILSEEIIDLTNSVAGGPDLETTYSLYDFRQDIDKMVAAEDPPYKAVDPRFLYNTALP